MKVSVYNHLYPDVKKTDRFIFNCNYKEVELTADEYCYLDQLLQAMSKGEVSKDSTYRNKRTGETFNLSKFGSLTRKKTLGEKIFGENIKL